MYEIHTAVVSYIKSRYIGLKYDNQKLSKLFLFCHLLWKISPFHETYLNFVKKKKKKSWKVQIKKKKFQIQQR